MVAVPDLWRLEFRLHGPEGKEHSGIIFTIGACVCALPGQANCGCSGGNYVYVLATVKLPRCGRGCRAPRSEVKGAFHAQHFPLHFRDARVVEEMACTFVLAPPDRTVQLSSQLLSSWRR